MLPHQNTDISTPFMLSHFPLRGRLVRLQEVTTTILSQHAYPFPVAKVLADLLAAGATLASLLKYEGVFTIQTKTSGPIGLAVIDVTHKGDMRGYAQFKVQEIKPEDTFKELLGSGYLAFTVDQGVVTDRYQGIVSLGHETLSHALAHYFDQSEQLETRLFIASEKTEEGIWKSAALLLQQMPSQRVSEETWNHVGALLNTLSPREFLDFSIPYPTFLHRLFHEGGLTVFDPMILNAQCRCSEERIKVFLASLPSDEIEDLLEKGRLKMTCEFCNHHYEFDRKDLMTVH